MSGPAPDYLVAGQGLAGTVFALSAIQRGLRVQVVDPEEPASCSRVAAGLMNPLSGPRLNLGPLEEAYWEQARAFYQHWEPILGVRCFEERPILRLLTQEDDARQWSKRASDPRYAPWHAPLPADWDASRYHNSLGGFTTLRCGRLDTVRFLDAAREWLRACGSYRPGLVPPEEPAVWCLGFRSREHGPFQSVPLRPARGTIFTIQAPELREDHLVHAGKWLVPIGGDRYRVGSTYEWDPQDAQPSAAARDALTTFLNEWLPCPWALLREVAGIRPMANRGQPFLGRHPTARGQILFNGLGSRGSLIAPYFASRLLDLLECGTPLDPQVDVRRFFP